jgi:hypothetical protein
MYAVWGEQAKSTPLWKRDLVNSYNLLRLRVQGSREKVIKSSYPGNASKLIKTPDTKTTQPRESGKNTFQPNLIN